MIDAVYLTALLVLVILVVLIFLSNWHHGPWGIPLLGFYPFLRQDFHIQLTEMSKKYGDAFILPMAGKLYLLLSSHKALHEAFVEKGHIFSSKNQEFSVLHHQLKDGLPFLNDEAWRVIRKYMSQCMRKFNLTPQELKDKISEPVRETIDILAESNGQPFDMFSILSSQCTKVVRRSMIGDVSDDLVYAYNRAYESSFNVVFSGPSILLCGNFTRYIIMPWVKGYKEFLAATDEVYSILNKIFKMHKENLDLDNPRDLMDYLLCEKKMKEEKGDPQAKYFTDEVLLATMVQYFGDGGSTIGAFVAEYLKELAKRIDVQNIIYEEISRKIGTNRLPTYEDRSILPVCVSVIKEIERISLSLPIIPKHVESDRDTTVSGIFVPKGTITLVNTYAIHNDPNVFKNPDCFIPERFVSADEKARPVTFGIGKRTCAGEPLIMAEIFLFMTAIMQRFTIQLKSEDPPLFVAIPRNAN